MSSRTATRERDAAKAAAARKPPKVYGVLLVSIPDFPPQDPGRPLVYRVFDAAVKAERKAKRFTKRYPDYRWEGVGMTHAEITAVKRRPITLDALGVRIEFTPSGGVRVVLLQGSRATRAGST